MLIILTGNGKGKTTAALGTALRAAGWGKKILIVQFIKSKGFSTGEARAIKKYLKDVIKIETLGLGFVGILNDKKTLKEHRTRALKALKKTNKLISSNQYNLIILDEIIGCIAGKLLTTKEIIDFINPMRKKTNIILTGRSVPKELIKMADLVSEIKNIKHPFDKGTQAVRGLDY